MEIPTVTLLKDAFTGEPSKSSKFEVTILKKYSDDKFLITDDSDHCTLRADPHKELYKYLLKENNKLRIINPKVDFAKKELKLEPTTSVVVIKNDKAQDKESQNDKSHEAGDKAADMNSKIQPILLEMSFVPINRTKNNTVAFKILKQLTRKSFIVADSSGHCNFEIDEKLLNYPEGLLKEGKCLKIIGAKVKKFSKSRTLTFDKESSAEEDGLISGIKSEVCYGCNAVLYGDDEFFDHFARFKSCKTTYEVGNGGDITLRDYWENTDSYDALRLKILNKLDDDMYEAADETGICRLKVHQENTLKELIDVGRTLAFMKPRCINSEEKLIQIGKACHIIQTPNLKIPIKIYNENLCNSEQVNS